MPACTALGRKSSTSVAACGLRGGAAALVVVFGPPALWSVVVSCPHADRVATSPSRRTSAAPRAMTRPGPRSAGRVKPSRRTGGAARRLPVHAAHEVRERDRLAGRPLLVIRLARGGGRVREHLVRHVED